MATGTASPERRLRRAIVVASVLFVSAPLAAAAVLGKLDEHMLDDETHRLRRLAADFAGRSPDELEALAAEHEVFVRILGVDGRVELTSAPHVRRGWTAVFFGPHGPPELRAYDESLRPLPERPEVRAALRGEAGETWVLDHSHRLVVFYRSQPMSDGRVLYLAQGILRGATAIHDLRWQLLNLTVFLVLLAVALGAAASLWVVRPLERMQRSVRTYLDGGPKPSLAIDRRDEIGALSRDFQEMIDRLQEQLADTSRATSDMTHDLKNRVASIAAGAEMLEDGGDERVLKIARVIRTSAAQLERTLEALLSLAQIEERLPTADVALTDLGDLCRGVLESYSAEVRLVAEPAPVRVIGDTMSVVVRNLVDNALAFADELVDVNVRRDGEQVVLRVADDGPGVSKGNRDRIFDRFFTARDGGSGLGLAIARTIVEAHRGTIGLGEASPHGGAVFEVRLDAAAGKPYQ